MSKPVSVEPGSLSINTNTRENNGTDESNPDNGEWGWSALGSEDDAVDLTISTGPPALLRETSVGSVASVDSAHPSSGPQSGPSNSNYKPRSPNSSRRGPGGSYGSPRGDAKPGITNSPSFSELEFAIGQTLALSITSTDSAEASSPVRNNSSSKLSATNLTQQKVQHQRMRQHQAENRRSSPYAAQTPRFFPSGPQSFTVMGMSVSTNIKTELGHFINESESRAIIIFHSPQVPPVSVRNACNKYGVLYYIRPEFHGRGVTFISYFDLRAAISAKSGLSEELGPEAEVAAHYSVMLHATNSNTEEFRLLVKDLPVDVVEDEVKSIFKRYGMLRSFERSDGNGNPVNPRTGIVTRSISTVSSSTEDSAESPVPEGGAAGAAAAQSEQEEGGSVRGEGGAPSAKGAGEDATSAASVTSSLSYSVEYFNIQDARLACSELSATTIPGWGSEASVRFAPLDERKQQLCRQLLATISRWRNEQASLYQQGSPLASPMHQAMPPVHGLVHSTSSGSIVSLGGVPPMMTPTGPYNTMFDRASPLTLDPASAAAAAAAAAANGGLFYSNSAPGSANSLVAMVNAVSSSSNNLSSHSGAGVLGPSLMSAEQMSLHHQQQQLALQQAQVQIHLLQQQQLSAMQMMYGGGGGGGSVSDHSGHGGMHNSAQRYGGAGGDMDISKNHNGYGGRNSFGPGQQTGGRGQQQHQSMHGQNQLQSHVQPPLYAQQMHPQQNQMGMNNRQNQPYSAYNQQQPQQQQLHNQFYPPSNSSNNSNSSSSNNPRGFPITSRTPSPGLNADGSGPHHGGLSYDQGGRSSIPPHHHGGGGGGGGMHGGSKIPPHHHNGGHTNTAHTMYPPQHLTPQQQQQQHSMYGGLNPSYLQHPRGTPSIQQQQQAAAAAMQRGMPPMQVHAPSYVQPQGPPRGPGGGYGGYAAHPGSGGGVNNHPIDEHFALDLGLIDQDKETRTTIMVRNIPNKYNQQMLLDEVNVNHEGTYDFFYLPIDFKNRCNVGYCFINFLEPHFIPPFVKEFNGQRWKSFNSEKVCAVSFARIQGKQAMIARFQNSSLLEKDDEYQPLLFYSSGPEKGKPEPFPTSSRRHMQQQQQHMTHHHHQQHQQHGHHQQHHSVGGGGHYHDAHDDYGDMS